MKQWWHGTLWHVHTALLKPEKGQVPEGAIKGAEYVVLPRQADRSLPGTLSFWPFRCNFMLLYSTSLFTFFLLFFPQGLTNTVCDFWVRNVSLILSESKGVKFSCIFTFWILLGEKKSLHPLFPLMIYMACLLWVLAVHYASHFPPLVYDHWVCLASVHLTFVYCGTQRFAGVMNLHGDLWHPTVFYSV